MNRLRIGLLVLFALAFSSVCLAQKTTPAESAKLRVLFIGNSYTYFNNLPRIVAGLAESAEQPIETEMIAIGGATLKRLWEEGKALEAIRKSKWDFVVLQEQSTLGPAPMVEGKIQISDPKLFHEYARLFDGEIKKAGAKTVFYLTWARLNAPETQAKLTAAYQSIAKELNAIVAPAGLAWETALRNNPRLALHVVDKSHPSPMGSYLAACVFYAALTGKNPEGLPGRILGPQIETSGKLKEDSNAELVNLNTAETSLLQRIAWETAKPMGK